MGLVWTLVAGEYWGHPSFGAFNRAMCERLAKLHPAALTVHADRPFAAPEIEGATGVLHGERLHLDMGGKWSAATVRIGFEK